MSDMIARGMASSAIVDLHSRSMNALYPHAPLVACKADGVTDDSTTIINLMSFASTNGYTQILFPNTLSGYLCNQPLGTMPSNVSLVGIQGTQFFFKNIGTNYAVTTYNNSNSGLISATLKPLVNIQIVSSDHSGNGLLVQGSHLSFDGVAIYGFNGNGLAFGTLNTYMIDFNNCLFHDNGTNIYCPTGLTNTGASIRFTKCDFNTGNPGRNQYGLLYLDSIWELTFLQCLFDYHVYTFAVGAPMYHVSIIDCEVEVGNTNPLFSSYTGNTNLGWPVMRECYWEYGTYTTAVPWIDTAFTNGRLVLRDVFDIPQGMIYNTQIVATTGADGLNTGAPGKAQMVSFPLYMPNGYQFTNLWGDMQLLVSVTLNPVSGPTSDPSTQLTLAEDTATTSALTAGTTYYVQYDFLNGAERTKVGTSQNSIALSTSGHDITTSITLPSTASGVDIYVGTTSNPLRLGTFVVNGSVLTYSGGKTSGLAVTVNGSVLNITISDIASATGSSAPTSNTTTGQGQFYMTLQNYNEPGETNTYFGNITPIMVPAGGQTGMKFQYSLYVPYNWRFNCYLSNGVINGAQSYALFTW